MAIPYSKLKGCMQKVKRKDNTSGINGVSKHKQSGRWSAILQFDKKINRKYLRTFESAARQRLIFEIKTFGIDKAPQKHLFKEYLTDKDLERYEIKE